MATKARKGAMGLAASLAVGLGFILFVAAYQPASSPTPTPVPPTPTPSPTATPQPAPTATPAPTPTPMPLPTPTPAPTLAERLRQVGASVVQVKTPMGSGSGVVSGPNLVLTAAHMVARNGSYTIVLPKGGELEARVVGLAEPVDIALLRVPGLAAAGLRPIPWGNESEVAIGDEAVAVGFPLAEMVGGQTATRGIVSAKRRDKDGNTVVQTDAPVNPGNSGGALVDAEGRLVGIISYKLRSSEGLSFAVGIDTIRALQPTLEMGRIVRSTPTPVSLASYASSMGRFRIKYPKSWTSPFPLNTESNWTTIVWAAPEMQGEVLIRWRLPEQGLQTQDYHAATTAVHRAENSAVVVLSDRTIPWKGAETYETSGVYRREETSSVRWIMTTYTFSKGNRVYQVITRVQNVASPDVRDAVEQMLASLTF